MLFAERAFREYDYDVYEDVRTDEEVGVSREKFRIFCNSNPRSNVAAETTSRFE